MFQQQTSGYGTVVRFLLDAAAGGHDQRRQHLFLSDTVVQVPQRPFHQGLAIDALQSLAGTLHLDFHQPQIQRRGLTVGFFHRERGMGLHRRQAGPLLGMSLPVEYIGAGHFLLLRPHQRQFHLVLDIFNVHLAAGFQASADGLHDLMGNLFHGIVDTGRARCFIAFDGKKRFGHGNTDFAGVESNQGAITFNNL